MRSVIRLGVCRHRACRPYLAALPMRFPCLSSDGAHEAQTGAVVGGLALIGAPKPASPNFPLDRPQLAAVCDVGKLREEGLTRALSHRILSTFCSFLPR